MEAAAAVASSAMVGGQVDRVEETREEGKATRCYADDTGGYWMVGPGQNEAGRLIVGGRKGRDQGGGDHLNFFRTGPKLAKH